MRKRLWLLVSLPLVAGCLSDSDIGERYRAERDLWQINREVKRLSIRPDLVEPAQWRELIDRYESFAQRYGSVTSGPEESAAREIRIIVARGLATAAQIHASLGDSARTIEIYSKIEAGFADLPLVSGDVALARGRMAEARRQWSEAIDAYQHVVQAVPPNPIGVGVERVVLELPLKIARIRIFDAKLDSTADLRPFYRPTTEYYQAILASEPEMSVAMQTRGFLAEVMGDQRDWEGALIQLHALAKDNSALDPPPQDPASIRLAIAATEKQANNLRASEVVLNSILDDYPASPYASQALMALALQAGEEDEWDKSLELLARIRQEYGDEENISAQALYMQGQVLEQTDRWNQALEVFRSLPVEHPTSEPALRAPLAVIAHYTRVDDQTGREAAINKAEKTYRDFLSRFPTGRSTYSAHDKLIGVLQLQEKWGNAITEMMTLGESLSRTPRGVNYFLNAARLAYRELGDTLRAAEILEHTGRMYAEGEIGAWAQQEALKLREGVAR